MKPSPRNLLSIIFVALLCFAVGCAATNKNFRKREQLALVYLGAKGGNRIVIPNFDKLPAFKIYRWSEDEKEFQFVIRLKRPSLPMRFKVSSYAVEWTDKGNFDLQARYRIIAVDKDDNELIEVRPVTAVPKDDGWILQNDK
jgi:hypothetical protein